MLFCKKCGSRIPDGASFCPVCGETASSEPNAARFEKAAGNENMTMAYTGGYENAASAAPAPQESAVRPPVNYGAASGYGSQPQPQRPPVGYGVPPVTSYSGVSARPQMQQQPVAAALSAPPTALRRSAPKWTVAALFTTLVNLALLFLPQVQVGLLDAKIKTPLFSLLNTLSPIWNDLRAVGATEQFTRGTEHLEEYIQTLQIFYYVWAGLLAFTLLSIVIMVASIARNKPIGGGSFVPLILSVLLVAAAQAGLILVLNSKLGDFDEFLRVTLELSIGGWCFFGCTVINFILLCIAAGVSTKERNAAEDLA